MRLWSASVVVSVAFAQINKARELYDFVPDGFNGSFEGMNATSFLETQSNDALFLAFEKEYNLAMSPLGRAEFSEEERKSIKKFKLLKHMILYLQQLPLFGKFCFYGCYCFANGPKNLLEPAGTAKPLDDADKSCKLHEQCHQCTRMDFGAEKCDVTTGYAFEAKPDPITGVRYIRCLNKKGSCKRSICECDAKLAYDLADYETSWNILHHAKWGQFGQEANCLAKNQLRTEAEKPTDIEYNCCGEYPNRFPFQSETSFSNRKITRECCYGKTFDATYNECCPDGRITFTGGC